MKYKTTSKLFLGKYPYKVVIRIPGATYLRGFDYADITKSINNINIAKNSSLARPGGWYRTSHLVCTKEQQQELLALHNHLQTIQNYKTRVEGSQLISVYLLNEKAVDDLIAVVKDKVQYVSKPPAGVELTDTSKVALPRMPYQYRVYVKTQKETHESFVSWAESMGDRVKLTWSCEQKLKGKRASWQSPVTYMYLKGAKELMLAQLHLGEIIKKIEENVTYIPKK